MRSRTLLEIMQIESPENLDNTVSPASDAKAQRGINALDSTGELLLALVSAGRPLSLRDLAAAAEMPAAKAFPHLVSLLKIGLLSRHDAGSFSPAPPSMPLGPIPSHPPSPTRH